MNKLMIIIICLVGVTQFALAQETNVEPPHLKLDVEVNGEKYQIKDGETITVNGSTIKVSSAANVTFHYGVLHFDYPKHYAFEYEADTGYQNWSLDGNNFVIMYFKFDDEVGLDDFISQMVSQFGEDSSKVTDKKIQLGDVALIGKRIDINIVGANLTYDMYLLDTADGATHFLSLQDTKNDDGSDSKEGIDTLKIMNKTLTISEG